MSDFAFKTKAAAKKWARDVNRSGTIGGNVKLSCPTGHRLHARVTNCSAPGFPYAVAVSCKKVR